MLASDSLLLFELCGSDLVLLLKLCGVAGLQRTEQTQRSRTQEALTKAPFFRRLMMLVASPFDNLLMWAGKSKFASSGSILAPQRLAI